MSEKVALPNRSKKQGLREFDHAKHHSVVEALKHTTSPLSAALFGVGATMLVTRKLTLQWWNARAFLRAAKRGGMTTPPTVTMKTAATTTPMKSAVPRQQRRPFSTSSFLAALPFPTLSTAARLGDFPRQRAFFSSSSISPSLLTITAPTSSVLSSTPPAGGFGGGGQEAAANVTEPLISATMPLLDRLALLYEPHAIEAVAWHIVDFPSVNFLEAYINSIHEAMGLPWWGSLCLATIGVRLLTLPFQAMMLRNQMRMKLLKPAVEQATEVMESTDMTITQSERVNAASRIVSLFKEAGVHPLKPLIIPTLFPPFMLSYFFAVQNTCLSAYGIEEGGTLWFHDLSQIDSTFVLPVAAALSWLAVIELTGGQYYMENAHTRMWCRIVCACFIPIMSQLPAGVFCFWITSNLWEIARVKVFNLDAVRSVLRIPLKSHLPPPKPTNW